MGMSREEVLAKIAKATVSAGGNNMRDGRYRLALRKFELADGYNGTRVVFEFVVVSAKKKPVVSVKTGQQLDVEPNPVGSDLSVVCMISKHESAFGNAKACILGLVGASDMSEQDMIDTMNDMLTSGAGVGRVVDCDTYRKEAQESKKELVLPKWYPVEQTDEQVTQMKNWFTQLDAAASATASAAVVPASA